MEYSKLIAITGMGGLFELVASKKDGAIVKSLDDSTTKFVSSRIHNFSHLESIEVYTVQDNVNLTDIFLAMKASAVPLPDDKDSAAVKKYFETVYGDMDFDRVYNSDMKKMVKWLKMLDAHQVEIKLSVAEAEEETEAKAPAAEAAPEEKPAKKAAAKKETADAEAAAPEEKPKKKAAAKAAKPVADDTAGEAPKKKAAAPRKKKEE
jgi:hypothetical protein